MTVTKAHVARKASDALALRRGHGVPARPAATDLPAFAPAAPGAVQLQRKSSCACGGGCPRCTVQTKLSIGTPGDPYEQEADRVAEQVMRLGVADVRAAATDKREALRSPRLRAHSATREGTEPAPSVAAQVEGLHGGGRPMSWAERAFFEPRFGTDFSAVRLHHGASAAQASRAMGARAFTVGTDIAFGDGEHRSGTSTGYALMAHELAHVIQQRGATRSLIRCNDRDITRLAMQERWAIAYRSAIRGAGDGVVMAMIILLACILILAAIAAIVAWLCPACIAAITAFLSTMVWGATVSAWLMALLASFGVASALVTMQREFGEVSRAVETARSEDELQRAGHRWGYNTAIAFVELVTAVFSASSRVRGFVSSLARRLPRRWPAVGGGGAGATSSIPPATGSRPTPGATPSTPNLPALEAEAAADAATPAFTSARAVIARVQAERTRLAGIITRLLRSPPSTRASFTIQVAEGGTPQTRLVGLDNIEAQKVGAEVRVSYEFINVPEALRGQHIGRALQQTYELAAVEAARQAGASQVRVMVRMVVNSDWGAALERYGYIVRLGIFTKVISL